jgi:adenosylcobinamide-GDP ribazoletransferase
MTGLRDAIALLTRLPPMIIGTFRVHGAEGADDQRSTAMAWFPLVGAIVGGIGVLTWVIADGFLGRAPAAVAAVLATIAVTGALHEDGLADTADGLWGGATRERRLEIMRDSNIGTYGAIALAGDLLLRAVLLTPLGLPDVARALIAGHVIARLAPLVITWWLPPARTDGLGAGIAGDAGRPAWLIACGTAAVAAIVAGGFWAPLLLVAAAAPVWLVGRAARNRIGGFTGDILGAAVLTSSLAVTATVAALVEAGAF